MHFVVNYIIKGHCTIPHIRSWAYISCIVWRYDIPPLSEDIMNKLTGGGGCGAGTLEVDSQLLDEPSSFGRDWKEPGDVLEDSTCFYTYTIRGPLTVLLDTS